MRIATILLAIPLVSVAAGTGRVERCNFDLRAPSRQIALHATEGLDTAVEASIRSDGTIPDLSGWSLLLWYGDAATTPPLGVAFTNVSLARGVARWDIPGEQIATNGRFTVQIVGSHTSGRSEEWARGWLAIDANPASSFSALAFGTPGWALATNVTALIAALTNGAALGAMALQPSWAATGTVAHAADAARLADTAGSTNSWSVLEHGTQQVYVVSYSQVAGIDTTVVRVAHADIGMEEPPAYSPAVGDIWPAATMGYEREGWTLLSGSPAQWAVRDEHGNLGTLGAAPTNVVFEIPMSWEISFEFPLATNSVPVTNIYPLARSADLAAHNTDGSAHPDIREAIDAIPLPPTNAVEGWLVWDSGSNCYWQVTATNLRFYVWGVAE